MSMVYLVWPLLYLLFPLPSLAGPLYTASLPPSVLDSVPQCAQSCVKKFVAQGFSSSGCGPRQELGCLCKSKSAFEFTLGEGAYLCVVSHCSDQGINEITSAFEICQSIPDAQPKTHGTLMSTQISSIDFFSSTCTHSTSGKMPSSSSTRAARTKTPMPSATSQPNPRSTSTMVGLLSSTPLGRSSTLPPAASSALPSTTATSTNSIATTSVSSAASAADAPKPALAKGQIAGIAIGGLACIAGAIGLVLFVFCIRRRRSNRRRLSGSSFGNDKIINSNPASPVFFPPRNKVTEQVQYGSPQFVPTGNLGSEQGRQMAFPRVERQHGFVTPERKSRSETTSGRRGLQPDEIGIAVGSETRERLAIDEPPASAASYRTTSKLLPDKPSYDKPSYSLFPQNSRSPVSPINSPLTGEAGIGQKGPMPLSRPSPRLGNPLATDQLQLQRGLPPMHASASDPFLDRHPASQPLTYTSPRRQPLRLVTPSNNRPNPQILQHGQWTQSLDDLPKPVAARHSSSARKLNRQPSALASISPNDYKGRALFQPSADRSTQVRREGQRAKATNKSGLSTARYSSASETNFEDTDDEEAIPPMPMPTSHHFFVPTQSSSDVASSRARGAATSRQFSQRPTPTSPTPNPARRNRLLPAPLSVQNAPGGNGMPKRKPLPGLPELPDTPVNATVLPELPDTPVNATVRGRRDNSPAVPRNSRRAIDDVRTTAKWQILVSPGLKGIDTSSTPPPKVGSKGKPATPSKQAATRTPAPSSRRS